ncbi:AAA family ATPase [uncultured Endozoicomonas sp.]|uniref:dTMP kinase n=1 Tax=uncultured Endozoicomonas sp. TaxID=432652 RepID=UPI00262C6D5A|nr:AAA family ATPase [uncultured Endozoicomonas sp.]
MFIAIEGLDGSGKSTVTTALARHLNIEHLTTPSTQYKMVRAEVDRIHNNDPFARQLFYASTVMQLSNTVSEMMKSGRSAIVDRYWLSTQVYHHWKTQGNSFPLKDVESRLVVPDATIFIHVPFQERKHRISSRNDNTTEDNKTLTAEADSTLNEFYRVIAGNSKVVGEWFEVDGTLPTRELVQHICDVLNR